jgi:hypothetical protein
MKMILSRVQRELPDTDRDRYDVAYERGRAQARSGLLFGGVALGSALGAGLMWLLDPERGAGRRTQLTSRLSRVGKSGGGESNSSSSSGGASGRIKDVQNRLRGFAIERGLMKPPTDTTTTTAPTSVTVVTAEYGEGYREGFGRTVADPDAPHGEVPGLGRPNDPAAAPLTADELETYGSAGPVAGATGLADTEPGTTETRIG